MTDYLDLLGCDIVEALMDYNRTDTDRLMDLAAEEIEKLRDDLLYMQDKIDELNEEYNYENYQRID